MGNLKSVLITGATGAIGRGIAKLMAEKEGYKVTILARNENKAINTVNELKKVSGNPQIDYIICDLSSKQEILATASKWKGPLHILINDAAVTPKAYTETAEGIEMQWATNVMGYFWMIKYFTPILQKSAPARIVNVASYWAGNMDINDLEFNKRHYHNDTAYRQSKQANRMLSVAFANKLKHSGISVNVCHPGDVRSTLASNLGYGGHETPEEGATTPVWLATAPELEGVTGKYFEHMRESFCSFGNNHEFVEKLYSLCEAY